MLAQETDTPIMMRLKTETQARHDATEDGSFNQELVKGRLPLDRYVESIAQLFLIHRALEAALRDNKSKHPAFARVLRDYQFQEPYLRDDLAYFERKADSIEALPATEKFLFAINRLVEQCPVGLLGMHYVFEGSNNGAKFISRAVRRAYALPEGRGTTYLDPYGENQRDYWQAFKDDMNASSFSQEESTALVHAACGAFDLTMQLHRELYEGVGPAPARPADEATPAAKPSGKCPFHHG